MLKKISVLLIILLALSAVIFRTYKIEGIIEVSEYGVVSEDKEAASDNRRIVNKLIRRAGENTVISFTGDVYYFDTNMSGAISVKNKKQITLKGSNTKFVNTSYSPVNVSTADYNKSNIIKIIDSENVSIEGICMDYLSHTNASGTIIAHNDGYTHIKLFDEYTDGEKSPLTGDEAAYGVNLFDKNGLPVDEFWFSPEKQKIFGMHDEEKGIFRLSGLYGKAGDNVCVRFTSGIYACPVIFAQNVKGLIIDKVTVLTSPSAVFYAVGDNRDFSFGNFTVKPEKQVLFASNEDCIHIKRLSGKLTLSDCIFEGIGDDALNIHSKAAEVKKIKDNTVIVSGAGNGGFSANNGDTVGFFDRSFNLLLTAQITDIHNDKIRFREDLKNVTEGCILQNLSSASKVTINNCTVNRGRARGFVIQSESADITNCSIRNIRLPAVMAAPDIAKWYEMGPVKNLNICNNSFVNCGAMQSSEASGVVTVSLNHDGAAVPETGAVHGNIVINNNIFENTLAQKEIYIRAAENVEINNNIFDKNIIDVK